MRLLLCGADIRQPASAYMRAIRCCRARTDPAGCAAEGKSWSVVGGARAGKGAAICSRVHARRARVAARSLCVGGGEGSVL